MGQLFSTELKINYDKRFIPIAQNFVEKNLELVGSDKKEIYQTSMVIEETLIFIIDKYIDNAFNALIKISLTVNSDSIELNLTNIGPPINPEKIPSFDIENIASADGLWYQMVQKFTSNFEFINNYNDGWIIRINKLISKISFSQNDNMSPQPDIKQQHQTFGKISTRFALPKDAPELVDLAYMTYRYSNGIPEFYDKNLLGQHIADKLYEIIVIEMDGKIIGAVNFKYTEYDPKSAEMGSAMIDPSYRNSKALLYIIRETNLYHKNNPRNLDFFVTYLVTTHTLSQRSVEKVNNGYKPFSISLGMIPRPVYIDIKDKIESRESLLNSFHLNNKLGIEYLYVSQANEQIVKKIIENSGNSVLLKTDEREVEVAKTEFFSFNIDSIKSSIISVSKLGKDCFNVLRKTMFSLLSQGIKTVIVSVPGDNPLPIDFEKKMADLNLIFCGLHIRSLSEIQLSYVLTLDPVDFNQIELANPVAQELLEHIKTRYAEVFEVSN